MLGKLRSKLKKIKLFLLISVQIVSLSVPCQAAMATGTTTLPKRQMENLDRGLVAVKTDSGVFVSWRLLGTEPDSTSFNLYRDNVKVNSTPIDKTTDYKDEAGTLTSKYTVRAIIGGVEKEASSQVAVWNTNYLSVPLQRPAGGISPAYVDEKKKNQPAAAYTYTASDASVGDVDGDGQYEIILKWDPSNSKDNSQYGYTGNVYIDAYKLDGTRLWRIDLGKNIRAGAHYTQFMVYDFDGDGKAEVACKTADGTIDGKGNVIGDASADYRNQVGYVLSGPEYLTIFEGSTGKQLATTSYDPPRGNIGDWGDTYGNRVDRFLGCVAYLDGVHPSLVTCRGYYTRLTMAAYNWRDGQLSKVWRFDSNDPGNSNYAGQGNHNLSVADVDGDGKDEIIYGSCAVDDNGTGMYTTGLGHGDAIHVGDLDPTHPGLEVFEVHEDAKAYAVAGAEMHDAKTGEILFEVPGTKDTGRGLSADIDPIHPGEENWAASGVGMHDAKGNAMTPAPSAMSNFAIWWDGDLQRELLDGTTIYKWDYVNTTTSAILSTGDPANPSLPSTSSVTSPLYCAYNNTTKANPCLQADILGDWREEVIWRNGDSTELRIYTTTDLDTTNLHLYTLMHDPVYRLGVAWQNVAYNQPPHTSFFLGYDMAKPPVPNIYTVTSNTITPQITVSDAKDKATAKVNIENSGNLEKPAALIIGLYDTNGKMVKATSTKVNIKPGETMPVSVELTLPNGVTGYTVKSEVWNNLTDMKVMSNTSKQVIN